MRLAKFILLVLVAAVTHTSLVLGQSPEPVGYWDNRFGPEDEGGMGANAFVLAAAVHPVTGDVYAGGSFTSAGGVRTFRIGRWNGSEWFPVGGGTRGEVRALAFAPDGTLYVVGAFTKVEQTDGTVIDAAFIAQWDGTSWSALGRGLSWRTQTLAYDARNGYLYVGGDFDFAINADSSIVASAKVVYWDGSNWQPMGRGLVPAFGHVVSTLAVDPTSDRVLVGGQLVRSVFNADSTEIVANGLAVWDGTSWSTIGSPESGLGLDEVVFDSGGQIYAGGIFTTIGGQEANSLARYNGNSWESLGGGIENGTVYTILPTEGGLFVG
ncbi:MAG: hypothetical protein ACC655_07970, partial [Rhodothermia bacterium]